MVFGNRRLLERQRQQSFLTPPLVGVFRKFGIENKPLQWIGLLARALVVTCCWYNVSGLMRRAFCLCTALWLAFACLSPAADVSNSGDARVWNGLLSLYDFRLVEGGLVPDRSGFGDNATLHIRTPKAVSSSEGFLELLGPATIISNERTVKISDMVRIAGEFTFEAWIRPGETKPSEPGVVFAMSNGTDQRNFALRQEGDRYQACFRTSKTDGEAAPGLQTAPGSARAKVTHVVYTRDRTGRARLFLDGRLAVEEFSAGSVSDWEKTNLTFGSESKIRLPWRGAYYLVAVYGRDLSADEVARNFRAGRAPVWGESPALARKTHLFEARVAPLLAQRCLMCHDSATKNGGLDLSKKAAAFAGGINGKAIQPGNARQSLVWLMTLSNAMPKGRMPLSADEKEILRQWIDAGAAWSYEMIDPAIHRGGDRGRGNWARRLTVSEYIESVRGALGVDVSKEAREILPPDLRADGFKNTSYNLNVDLRHVEAYARLAELAVARADLSGFAGSGAELGDEQIARMGRRILRGPISEIESRLYSELASTVIAAGSNAKEAAASVAEAMLQSPRFLYLVEQQRGDGTVWPTEAHELASRLSYILWGAPPDNELIRAADSGALYEDAEIERGVRRMLADSRAMARSIDFISQWLNLDGLKSLSAKPQMFPKWDPALAEDMRRETVAFFEDLIWKQKHPLANLLNAQFTYLTPRLARHYGLEPAGPGLKRYDLSATPSRGGLLTQGSVLTVGGDEASMVSRGLFVLKDLLFGEVGDPPPGLDTRPVPVSPGRSHRAIAMERVKNPSCGGCHGKFEPLAFALERFDGRGSYHQVDEHGNKLRQDGQILFPGEAKPVPYATLAEMMDLLAGSGRVQRNITRKLTQFAIGRPLVASDETTVEQIHEAAQRGGGTYESTITAIVMSDLVRMKRTEF